MSSDRILDEIEAAVPAAPAGEGWPARKIHGKVPHRAFVTVRTALADLVDCGRVIVEGAKRFQRYRREGRVDGQR